MSRETVTLCGGRLKIVGIATCYQLNHRDCFRCAVLLLPKFVHRIADGLAGDRNTFHLGPITLTIAHSP